MLLRKTISSDFDFDFDFVLFECDPQDFRMGQNSDIPSKESQRKSGFHMTESSPSTTIDPSQILVVVINLLACYGSTHKTMKSLRNRIEPTRREGSTLACSAQ